MKNLYIPTEEELKEMKFKKDHWWWYRHVCERLNLTFTTWDNVWIIAREYVFPESRQDIETLIRLFTK